MNTEAPARTSAQKHLNVAIVALVFVMAHVIRHDHPTAQVQVPPSASLDVQVPAAPTPVRIGGRIHLAYELHITNFTAVDLALARIDVLGDQQNGVPLASYQDAELRSGLARAGARPDASDKRLIGGGMRVVFFIWLALDDTTPVPSALHHRISFNVPAPSGDIGVVVTDRVGVGHGAPIVLGPPLRGGPWIAVYDPSSIGGHRRALFAIGGKVRIPARFAIDWVKQGDSGYGADVLAVADGVVADAVDGLAEPTVPITRDNESGNYIALDLGGGRFAFYEHLKPGSITVKVGDRVRSGDVLALLGRSGSVSSGAHLHFHVSDANLPLGAEGIPYVFGRFEQMVGPQVTTHRMEMPPSQAVLRF